MSDPDHADRPATFREVLAGEYRAVYVAGTLSWFGDYAARAAITALVYQQTDSVLAAAAAFAISYLPWVGIGPVLAALAERYPYRRTMIVADLLRMGIVALIAVPGLPVWSMIALLFLTALCNPPFDAARSALMARILDGDRYVVGLALHTTTHQVAQVLGYVVGAALAGYDARIALLINAATFGISAALLGVGVRRRPPALAPAQRSHLLRETAEGIGLVLGTPVLRAIAVVVFASTLFAVVPEGLAVAWADQLTDSPGERGWVQGAIMMANPVGFVLGGLVVGRFAAPSVRRRLIRPFALLVPTVLVPAVFGPPVFGVMVMSAVCGFAIAGLMPAANGLFVQALPDAYRARAFGVMGSGIQLMQGTAVLVTGALAGRFPVSTVVGVWSLAGVVLMVMAAMAWPGQRTFVAAIERARRLNDAPAPTPTGPGGAAKATAGALVAAGPADSRHRSAANA